MRVWIILFVIIIFLEFGQKIRFDFGMSVFAFVGFYNAEYTSSFLLRFISMAQEHSPEYRAYLKELLKCIVAKLKTHRKRKIFIRKSNLFFPKLSNDDTQRYTRYLSSKFY